MFFKENSHLYIYKKVQIMHGSVYHGFGMCYVQGKKDYGQIKIFKLQATAQIKTIEQRYKLNKQCFWGYLGV